MRESYEKSVRPFLKQIGLMAMCGEGPEEIARLCGVSAENLEKWRKKYPELAQALDEKQHADLMVRKAFFKKACGYVAEEEICEYKGKPGADGSRSDEQTVRKTTKKDVPPDLAAIKWWLANGEDAPENTEALELEEARRLLLERQRLLEND